MTCQREIDATHPARDGNGELELDADFLAMKLVGERHEKRELVNLVRWLILRRPCDLLPERETELLTGGARPDIVGCADCGKPYEDFPLDVVLPNVQWALIAPNREHGTGILCAACIVERAAKLPGVVVARLQLETPRDEKDT